MTQELVYSNSGHNFQPAADLREESALGQGTEKSLGVSCLLPSRLLQAPSALLWNGGGCPGDSLLACSWLLVTAFLGRQVPCGSITGHSQGQTLGSSLAFLGVHGYT